MRKEGETSRFNQINDNGSPEGRLPEEENSGTY